MGMKKTKSISLIGEFWEALQLEADKKSTTLNALMGDIVKAFFNDTPLISELQTLDLEIKRATKRIKVAEARIKEKIADHYEVFGVQPSPQATQAIKTGETTSRYNADQWNQIFKVMVVQTEDMQYFSDILENCESRFTSRDNMKLHLIHAHPKETEFASKRLIP